MTRISISNPFKPAFVPPAGLVTLIALRPRGFKLWPPMMQYVATETDMEGWWFTEVDVDAITIRHADGMEQTIYREGASA